MGACARSDSPQLVTQLPSVSGCACSVYLGEGSLALCAFCVWCLPCGMVPLRRFHAAACQNVLSKAGPGWGETTVCSSVCPLMDAWVASASTFWLLL